MKSSNRINKESRSESAEETCRVMRAKRRAMMRKVLMIDISNADSEEEGPIREGIATMRRAKSKEQAEVEVERMKLVVTIKESAAMIGNREAREKAVKIRVTMTL